MAELNTANQTWKAMKEPSYKYCGNCKHQGDHHMILANEAGFICGGPGSSKDEWEWNGIK